MIDLKEIDENPHLLDTMIEIEDVLDSLDVYVFRNWMKGEVVDGPHIKRHWVTMTLAYALKQMPDPKGGLRLLHHGVIVKYRKEEFREEEHWLVELKVPRSLLTGESDPSVEYYEDEVDTEDVDDAVDLGVDDETGYTK